MTGWHEQTMYGFDIESTGVNVFADRIIQAAVVKLEPGATAATDHRMWLADPGIPIPEGATAVHGITDERVRDLGADAKDVVGQVADTVAGVLKAGCPLVVFNAAFDLSMLDAECARWALPTLTDRLDGDQWRSVVDPCVLTRYIYTRDRRQKGKQFTLTFCCAEYKVPFEEKHEATNDAEASVVLARAIATDEDHIAQMGPRALHTLQRTARRTRQRNLKRFFDEQGIEYDDVDPGWPLHTHLQTEEAPA